MKQEFRVHNSKEEVTDDGDTFLHLDKHSMDVQSKTSNINPLSAILDDEFLDLIYGPTATDYPLLLPPKKFNSEKWHSIPSLQWWDKMEESLKYST